MDAKADSVVMAWANGKRIQEMLITLSEVWPGLRKFEPTMDVRKEYLRVCRKIHPDKQPKTATDYQRAMSKAVFAALTDAYRFFLEDGPQIN